MKNKITIKLMEHCVDGHMPLAKHISYAMDKYLPNWIHVELIDIPNWLNIPEYLEPKKRVSEIYDKYTSDCVIMTHHTYGDEDMAVTISNNGEIIGSIRKCDFERDEYDTAGVVENFCVNVTKYITELLSPMEYKLTHIKLPRKRKKEYIKILGKDNYAGMKNTLGNNLTNKFGKDYVTSVGDTLGITAKCVSNW